MNLVLRFPLERRRAAVRAGAPLAPAEVGTILVLPVVRIERHDLPDPPRLTADPPARGGGKPKRGRTSA